MTVDCKSLSIDVLSFLYETGEAVTPSADLKWACKNLIDRLYSELPFEIGFVNNDEPYSSCAEMVEKVNTSGVMWVSSLHNQSPVFDEITNLRFRAVHDYHHMILNAPFTFTGEYETWLYLCKEVDRFYPIFGKLVKQVFFSEIVLQVAYYEQNKKFIDVQKLVLV